MPIERPDQRDVSAHIARCRKDAELHQRYLSEGNTFYNTTINLLHSRVIELRQIADMYQVMCQRLPSPLPLKHREDKEATTNTEYTDISVVLLLDEYRRTKENSSIKDHTSTKVMKQMLGQNINQLYDSLAEFESQPIMQIFIVTLTLWFNGRCNWPPKDENRHLIYNLAKFPESLDAMILAYAAAVSADNLCESAYYRATEFKETVIEWIHNEGEGHRRGQPDPYKKEKYGLVSTEIVKYMVPSRSSKYEDILCDEKISIITKSLAISIEDAIKPVIYASKCSEDNIIIDSYIHSLHNRIIEHDFSFQPADVSTWLAASGRAL